MLVGMGRRLVLVGNGDHRAKRIALWDFNRTAHSLVIESGHLVHSQTQRDRFDNQRRGGRELMTTPLRWGAATSCYNRKGWNPPI